MKPLKVKRVEKFKYFNYPSSKMDSVLLGKIVNKNNDIGVVIQTYNDGTFRTDMFGNSSFSECRYANKKEIEAFRPQLLSDLTINPNKQELKGNIPDEYFNDEIVQNYIKNNIVFGYLGEDRDLIVDDYVFSAIEEAGTFTKKRVCSFLISSDGRHIVPFLMNNRNNKEKIKEIVLNKLSSFVIK